MSEVQPTLTPGLLSLSSTASFEQVFLTMTLWDTQVDSHSIESKTGSQVVAGTIPHSIKHAHLPHSSSCIFYRKFVPRRDGSRVAWEPVPNAEFQTRKIRTFAFRWTCQHLKAVVLNLLYLTKKALKKQQHRARLKKGQSLGKGGPRQEL